MIPPMNDPTWITDSMETRAADDVGGGKQHGAESGLATHTHATNEIASPGFGKNVITGLPSELTPDNELVRESWISFSSASTSRTSAAPSLFSRASTASAMTGYSARQSFLEDPIAEVNEVCPNDGESGCSSNPVYFCTFCNDRFDDKTDWKLHEFEFHDRPERQACMVCRATFHRKVDLSEHLQAEHGQPFRALNHAVCFAPIRSAWGCGFCAAPFRSRTDFLEHIGNHYEEGKGPSEWQHTRVIEGLLAQPKVAPAWKALVSSEEQKQGTRLRFQWEAEATGRTSGPQFSRVDELTSLQDYLEFFGEGLRTAEEVAVVAYRSAQIRVERDVSDLIGQLNLRRPERESSMFPAAEGLGIQQLSALTGEGDGVRSPVVPVSGPSQPQVTSPRVDASNLPATPRPPTPVPSSPAPFSQRFARSTEFPRAMTPPVARRAGTPSPPLPPGSNPLRRVDSARDLVMKQGASPKQSGVDAGPLRLRVQSPRLSPGAATPPLRSSSLPRVARGLEVSPRASSRRPLGAVFSAEATVRSHTSSSTLSTRTGDGSQRQDCDSVGELLSDDSLSEPDFCLESERVPSTAQAWMRAFHQSTTRGMEKLWVRYNREWDAMIRQCAGGRPGNAGQQSQNSTGRTRRGTAHLAPNNAGLRPQGGPFGNDEEDDDDEGDVYRPPSSQSKRSPDGVKRFACPFRKHDPATYNIHDHEVCAVRSWTTISRLKEHLYRRHYKAHCQRCKRVFSDSKELADHEMSVVSCEVINVMPPGDISAEQEKALKSRKHTTRRQSDEEKWRDIYRLLFPDEEVPSPYPEPAEDLVSTGSETHINLNFQHFLLTEMPNLFTKTVSEHNLQAHLPMPLIRTLMEEALQKAFQAWESRGSELPRRAASDASLSILSEAPSAPLSYNSLEPRSTPAYQSPLAAPVTSTGGLNPVGGYTQTAHHHHQHHQQHHHHHFSNLNFVPDLGPHTTHSDDSGFSEAGLFVTAAAAPVSFNAFAAHYGAEREWQTGFGEMDSGGFETDMHLGGGFRGFRGG